MSLAIVTTLASTASIASGYSIHNTIGISTTLGSTLTFGKFSIIGVGITPTGLTGGNSAPLFEITHAQGYPVSIQWQQGQTLIHGFDPVTGNWVNTPISFGIVFPGQTSSPLLLSIFSSSMQRLSYDSLTNVQLALVEELPTGVTCSISFDEGTTYQVMSIEPILLPAGAIVSPDAVDGVITAFDKALIQLKLNVDISVMTYQAYPVNINVTADVV